jgi:hypothetical protein
MAYKDSKGRTRKHVAYPGTKRGDSYCARSSKVNASGGGSRSVDCSGKDKGSKSCERRKAWGCKGKKSYAKRKAKK